MRLTDDQLVAFAEFIGLPTSPKTPLHLTRDRLLKAQARTPAIGDFRSRFERECESLTGDGPHYFTGSLWQAFLIGHGEFFAVFDTPRRGLPTHSSAARRRFELLRVVDVNDETPSGLILQCKALDAAIYFPEERSQHGTWARRSFERIELHSDQIVRFQPVFSLLEEDIIGFVREQELGHANSLRARPVQSSEQQPTPSAPRAARVSAEMAPLNPRGCFFKVVTFPMLVVITTAVAVKSIFEAKNKAS